MNFEYIFALTNTSIVLCNIYIKNRAMRCLKMLFIITYSVVFEICIMLGDFSISLIQISSFFWCIKFQPLSSVVSSLSIFVIDWCRIEVRDKSDDDLILFIQIMREINCSMIIKTETNWNLKYVISKLKDEYWDNTKSRKNNKKGLGRWENVLQWKALQHKVDIDTKRQFVSEICYSLMKFTNSNSFL